MTEVQNTFKKLMPPPPPPYIYNIYQGTGKRPQDNCPIKLTVVDILKTKKDLIKI